MTKPEFIAQLRKKLSGLPNQDIEDRLNFYSEMIDDRIEDGLTEEEAISDIGSVDEISAHIIADIPLTRIAKERIKPKRQLKAWEIILLALGSPIWLSLAVAILAVIIAVYIVLLSVIVSLWAVQASLIACATCGVVVGIILAIVGNRLAGIAMIGAGMICAGLTIFLFFGCREATRGIILLTKKIALCIKKCFVGKEKV